MVDDTIKIEMSFTAPIEKLWNAWTDPAHILQWFGSDPNGKGISAQMNVKPGGYYKITFQNADGTQYTCMGKYLVVEKFTRLSFSWEWENEPGVESRVIVLLSPENNTTHMNFTHEDVGKASAHNYMAGWKSTFSKLEILLGNLTS